MRKISVFLLSTVVVFGSVFLFAQSARAAVTATQPMDYLWQSTTVGPGAIIPLVDFSFSSDSSDTLAKVGFYINASSSMTQGEISRVSLWRESGTNWGFQTREDVFIAGAASTSPMVDGTLIVLTPTTAATIGSTATQFYIVASTTSIGNITNGDGFDVSMDANFASTTAGAGVGNAFVPAYKYLLEQTAPIKISEVKLGATGNAGDEFIELYNTTDFAVDLEDLGLALHTYDASGGAHNKTLSYYETIIPGFGFFLLGSATNYSGSVPLDATYDTLSHGLISVAGFSIATSTAIANATSTKIDCLAWHANLNTSGETAATTTDLAVDLSFERKATTTATETSMATGGTHAYKGNGHDDDDNRTDFVERATPDPQGSYSSSEFSFGDDSGDSTAPRVMGSYPDSGMQGVPTDMSFVGLGFTEPVTSSTVDTTSITLTTGGGSNLCSTVTYDPSATPQVRCNLSSNFAASTNYTLTASTSIKDFDNNYLDQESYTAGLQGFSATFTTSGGGDGGTMTNMTPPHVMGSSPFSGAGSVPKNIDKIFVQFDQNMDTSTFTASLITLRSGSETGTIITLGDMTFDATTTTLTIDVSSVTFVVNTHYVLTIESGVESSNDVPMGYSEYVHFDTASAANGDTSAPTVLGTMPITNGASNVALNKVSQIFMFDDHIDMSTATSGAVTLALSSGVLIPGTVSYDPMMKELSFTANNLLPASQTGMVFTLKGASLKNVSGVALGSDYTLTFDTEAVNSDSTAPTVMFVNADNFALSVDFDEAVKSTDAENLSNYSLTVGGESFTLSAMAGHSISYDTEWRSAHFQNINLPPASVFSLTISGIRDVSGNLMSSQTMGGTVQSFADSGGSLGMGQMTGDFGPPPDMSFDMGGGMGCFMPGANIMPFNKFKSASSTYGFELPLEQQIDADGTIVIAFPQTSDFDFCCVATTSSAHFGQANNDINGPGPLIVGIKTIASSNTAKTITLTLDNQTRSVGGDGHDFLHFDILDIKNPSVPKGPDSGGYSVTITTKNSSGNILETFSSIPVFIGGGGFGGVGTTTLRGQILSGYDDTTGLNGVGVTLGSPMTGPMLVTTANSAWGSADGEFQFTDLPVGFDFMLFTDPIVSPSGTTTGYFGSNEPRPIRATSTDIHLQNIILTATTSAQTFTVKATAVANTFTASEKIDVFAGGPGQFTVQTVTPGASALDADTIATLSLPRQNGMWNIGIGPAMPKDGMFMGPPPTVDWIMPKPIEIQMSGCPSACLTTIEGSTATSHTFAVSSSDQQITGVLKDEGSNYIANAEIFAYSPGHGFGTHTQTGSDGTFTLNVTTGMYQVGAFSPGMGGSREVSVEVTATQFYVDGAVSTGSTGSNPFVLRMSRPAYTITGRVTDGTNAVPNAPIFAYRTNGPGHSDAMTDSSGNYTLYVDNGTWNVGGFLPGYGPLTEVSRTVNGANIENVDFRPTLGVTFYDISGTVFESADATIDSGEGIAGVMINARSATGKFYNAKTGTDGTYTLRVAEGNGYKLELFKPDYGMIPAEFATGELIGSFNVTGATTTNIRMTARNTVTINVKNASGEMMEVPEAFVDLFDITRNFGNHAEIRNASSTTIQLPNASTTVRVFIPSVPPGSVSVASDDASNTFVVGGVLGINGDETIKIVVDTNLRTITGTVADTDTIAVTDTWIELIDVSNGMHFGTNATSSSFTVKAADGTYKIMAMKPRYTMTPQDLVVDEDETVALVLNSAGLTLSGTITAGGSAANEAFVRAEKVGGGFVATQADANGNYTLSVNEGTWRIFGASHKYTEAAYSGNPLAVSSSQTGVNIALTTAASIQDNLVTSDSFTDTSSGSFNDETVNVSVVVDSGALGQAGSSAYVTAQETVNYVNTPSVDIIGNKAKDIKAYAGGTQVTQFQSGKKAQVELTYTLTELDTMDTPSEIDNLKVAAWSDSLQDWESLNTVPTYKDTNGDPVEVASGATIIPTNVTQVTFKTTEATHFSAFALVDPTDPAAPATPSGVAATAAAAGTNQVTVSWSASANATGYYVYRNTSGSGSFPLLADAGNVTSYTDTSLSYDTTYYYKVAAYKSGGSSESSASGAVSATPVGVSGGGIVGGGGGGGGYSAPTVPSQTSEEEEEALAAEEEPVITEEIIAQAPAISETIAIAPSAVSVSPVFTLRMSKGMSNSSIKRLQQLLNSDPDTQIAESGVGSPGNETNYFGSLTRVAVRKFQAKYDIVSSGDENTTGYGLVGPSTRAKLQEVFAKAEPTAPEVAQPSAAAVSVSPVFNSGLDKGMSNSSVKRLQQLLNSDPDTRIAESGVGSAGSETNYFGTLTQKAVQKFQEKYGVAVTGDPGYGYVGPKTRAKLAEVFSETAVEPAVVEEPTEEQEQTEVESLELQIQELMQQIQNLQAEIEAMQ